MLCAPCRRSLLARLPTFHNHLPQRAVLLPSRSIATTTSSTTTSTNPPPPSPSSTSTPPTPEATSPPTPSAPKTAKPKQRSSISGGAVLNGLGYTKAKPQLLAKEDEEYPAWLWGILENSASSSSAAGGAVDVASLTKKQRAKHARKQSKLANSSSSSHLPPPVPVHEQSRDLTSTSTTTATATGGGGGDAGNDADGPLVSLQRRQEIVRSSRVARRKGIREDNFLRGL